MHINHVTLNTGHIRKTTPNDVDNGIYFILNRIYRDSFGSNGAKFTIKNKEYVVKGTRFDNGAIFTLYASDMPIITTAATKNKNKELWLSLINTATVPDLAAKDEPKAPYIVDRLEVGAMMHMDALSWTGDFTRCIGWITLFPEKIRQQRGAQN